MTEMAAQGDVVTVVQACRRAGVSRRSYYYRPTQAKPRLNEHLAVMPVIRPALWLAGGKAVMIREAGAGPGYSIDVKELLTDTPPAYHRGLRDSQSVCFCATPAAGGPSAAGLLISFSTF